MAQEGLGAILRSGEGVCGDCRHRKWVVLMSEASMRTVVIERAVELACRAPSLHNSQPWRWVAWTGRCCTCSLIPLDRAAHRQHGREVIISCGAVLDHLRIAMAAAGSQKRPSTGFRTQATVIIWRASSSSGCRSLPPTSVTVPARSGDAAPIGLPSPRPFGGACSNPFCGHRRQQRGESEHDR